MTSSLPPWGPRGPRGRALAGAGCLGLIMLLAGCGSSDPDQQAEETPSNTIPQPEHDGDDSVRLPLAMVSPAGQTPSEPPAEEGALEGSQAPGSPVQEAPEGEQPHEIEIARTATFGCEDTVSVIRSVPMVTEDPAVAALEYLFADELGAHGSPAFSNPLAASAELRVDSVEVQQDTVLVALSGEPVTTSECESWQILTQIETTARVATGATYSEVTVGSQPLAELLGLPAEREPLEITEITH